MIARVVFLVFLCIGVTAAGAVAQTEEVPVAGDTLKVPAPVPVVSVKNHKYDNGGRLNIRWEPSPDGPAGIALYRIYRAINGEEFQLLDEALPGDTTYFDETVTDAVEYRYMIGAVGSNGAESRSDPSIPVSSTWEFFDLDKLNMLVLGMIICGSVIWYINSAKSGKKLFIRKIGGLEALEEAVGRATEMGRPILYIPGILDMDDVQTLAAITILGKVASVVAEYDSKIHMPVSRSLVMTTARETIKTAYITAGRPDAYSDDMATYVTDEQFGYVAAVNGIMVREKPATCLYLGAFFAESLILAETGNSIGAIQIAGTARPGQLPFFVAACDYTLIGEELFAASAYLSGDPKQLGSLRGQDVGKIIAMIGIIGGTISITIATVWDIPVMQGVVDVLTAIFSSAR